MKECFRIKNFRKSIRVSFKAADGSKQIFETSQDDLIMSIVDIIEDYIDQGYKLTARQLYYQLVSRDIIPNALEIYTRICSLLTDLRYAGIIDWAAIEDRGRVPTKHSEWENIGQLVESALYAYRLPRWSDQEYYIESYCEKQALESILKPIADKFHIYFGVNKGYSSASTMYSIAKRIGEKIEDGKCARILYLGDHDPSGLDMVRDIQTRVCEFLKLNEDNVYFGVNQIALNKRQIKKYELPPNPAKFTDPRAAWYLSEHGDESWELDALEPEVLSTITVEAILNFLDLKMYEKWIKREKREGKKLKEFGETL